MFERAVPICLVLAALAAPAGSAWAQEPGMPEIDPSQIPQGAPVAQTVTVMGHEVLPKKGLFEVTADLNVRDGPGTDFKRVAGLAKGDRVRAVGRSEDGQWVAVSRDGETLGFVYAPVLVAVVDGTLEEQFFGSFSSEEALDGVACDYRFRYEGKSDVEGGDFETADYEIRFRCASREGAALFYGHMFLTEAPVVHSKGLHLIELDVRSIGDGMEEFLTTRYFYHPKTGEMKFDGHSLPRFALPPEVQEFRTKSIKEALRTALETSIASWTDAAWTTLFAKPE